MSGDQQFLDMDSDFAELLADVIYAALPRDDLLELADAFRRASVAEKRFLLEAALIRAVKTVPAERRSIITAALFRTMKTVHDELLRGRHG